MQKIYTCVVSIVGLLFIHIQATGQEVDNDTIRIDNSGKFKTSVSLIPAMPSLESQSPDFQIIDNSQQEMLFYPRFQLFNQREQLKYINYVPVDSFSTGLPAYVGLGDSKIFGGTLGHFNLINGQSLEYGAFINAQSGYLFSTKQIVVGGNFLFKQTITDRLELLIWGQYVVPGKSFDPALKIPSFFKTSSFGTALQYNSGQNTKIKVGIDYQYDQSDKQWKAESGGKVLLKF